MISCVIATIYFLSKRQFDQWNDIRKLQRSDVVHDAWNMIAWITFNKVSGKWYVHEDHEACHLHVFVKQIKLRKGRCCKNIINWHIFFQLFSNADLSKTFRYMISTCRVSVWMSLSFLKLGAFDHDRSCFLEGGWRHSAFYSLIAVWTPYRI